MLFYLNLPRKIKNELGNSDILIQPLYEALEWEELEELETFFIKESMLVIIIEIRKLGKALM
jgi:hypothetical protein